MLPTRNYTVDGMTCGHCRAVRHRGGPAGRGRQGRRRRPRQRPLTVAGESLRGRRDPRRSRRGGLHARVMTRGRPRRGVRRAARRDLRARRARRARALDPATTARRAGGTTRGATAHGTATTPARRPAATAPAPRRRRHDARPPAARSASRSAIVDEHGATVRDFEPEQARRMHLIVVRRDLRRFQHLHPAQDASGGWSTSLTLPDAGVYHAFADFRSGGERHTLGIDLFAAGRFEPLALPRAEHDRARRRLRGRAARAERRRAALRRQPRRRGGRRPAALPRRARPPRHAARRRPRLRARPPAATATTLAVRRPATPRPARYRLFLQFRHARRASTPPPSRTRWRHDAPSARASSCRSAA